jgi:hypothetical protein
MADTRVGPDVELAPPSQVHCPSRCPVWMFPSPRIRFHLCLAGITPAYQPYGQPDAAKGRCDCVPVFPIPLGREPPLTDTQADVLGGMHQRRDGFELYQIRGIPRAIVAGADTAPSPLAASPLTRGRGLKRRSALARLCRTGSPFMRGHGLIFRTAAPTKCDDPVAKPRLVLG